MKRPALALALALGAALDRLDHLVEHGVEGLEVAPLHHRRDAAQLLDALELAARPAELLASALVV